jgi:cell division protein FtsI (penicillin-binding protein 3)
MTDLRADAPASRRVRWIVRWACIWAALILGRLIFLQVVNQKQYRELALNQQTQLRQVEPPRGTIFDRNGQPLAMSIPVETVTVNPKLLPNRELAAKLLASVLDLDEAQLAARIETAFQNRKGYLIVARQVDAIRAARLRGLGVDWISFEPRGIRRYPNGRVAAHVLGGVDHEEHGNAGAELQFDDDLGGFPGYEWVTTDVRRRGFDSTMEMEPQESHNLVLTIDRRIQFAADEALEKAVKENGCDSGSAVVMNPETGEILALSNYPVYDPNEAPRSAADYDARKNRAVGDPFEPGSVFKVFTIAAALETTDITPQTQIHCQNGVLHLPGRVIHEAKGGYGLLSVEDILAKSSNIGAIKIGMKMGNAKLREYLLRFGFSQPTGIDLPGESGGLVRRLDRWTVGSMGSVAMGHEVLTTSVQLARAVSVIANNGYLVRPVLTLSRPVSGVRIQAVAYEPRAEQPERIIKPETAITMRQMMEQVVLRGTGKSARLDGYTSGGKTGTAQMIDKATGRYSHRYNASFMGFAPVTNPAITVVVTLNNSSKYGGVIAAPVFKQIAQTALRVLNVPQDNVDPRVPAPAENLAVADVTMPAMPAAEAVSFQRDVAEVEGQQMAIATGPSVPNFIGKPVRGVLEEAAARGVRVELSGSGVARWQEPAPGMRLLAGQKVKVSFEP